MGDATKIFLLANFTVESLAIRLKTVVNSQLQASESKNLRLSSFDVKTLAGFDTWRMELLNPNSPIWSDESRGAIIFILLHGAALFPEGVVSNDFSATLDAALEVIREAKNAHPDRAGQIVVSTLDLPSQPAQPLTCENFTRKAEAYWRGALEKIGVAMLDLADLVCNVGRENFYNAKTWYFGALPFSSVGEKRLAHEIVRVANVLTRPRKKCLVLDLDGVMWGGVIGEDGLDGIKLASHGIGSVYRDVQVIAKNLSRQGVILAINSKNNPDDALLPFKKHPSTVLTENDFAAVRANWQPKSRNIEELAIELNIGLDSMVFIDDNPVERASMKDAHPEVSVPDFPDDTAVIPSFMCEVAREFFTAARLDPEDASKTAMYRAEVQRARDREAFLSKSNTNNTTGAHVTLKDYLRSLEMRLDVQALDENNLSRAAQLCAKTNQFNLTTQRHSESDLRAMMTDSQYKLWIASLSDRYGDYGRIALVIAKIDRENHTAVFDTFLMSCRAMGRGVESAILGRIENDLARDNSVTQLTGYFIPTAKNAPVKDFWANMGYTHKCRSERADSIVNDAEVYTLGAPFSERHWSGISD